VRILDPHSATRAATRVECTFKEKITGKVWTTVSVECCVEINQQASRR